MQIITKPSISYNLAAIGLGIVFLVVVGVMYYSSYIERNITSRYVPLVDATMEIKLEATMAHLWFEEGISGDQSVDIETVWDHIDQARWYVQAMLKGGTNPEGTFLPLDDDTLSAKIKEVLNGLDTFQTIAEERWNTPSEVGIGTDIDQRFDATFERFLISADEVETALQQAIRKKLMVVSATQYSLIVIVIALGIFITVMFRKSERQRTKYIRTLHDSECKLREAQDMAQLGYWSWDVKTGGVEWSDHVYRIFHLNPDEFTPQIDSILALSPWPQDSQRGKELIQRAIESHEKGTYEQRFLRPDGSTGYYFSTFQGVYDNRNDLIAMKGTVQDITDRKEAEQALKDRQSEMEQIFEAVPDALIYTDKERRITRVNTSFTRIFGYTRQDVLGRETSMLYAHPDDFDKSGQQRFNPEAGRIHEPSEIEFRRNNRDIFPGEMVGTAVRDTQDNLIGYLGLIRDITERKQAQLDRERLLRILATKNEELQSIIYISSHDLRSPLVNINGFCGMLKEHCQLLHDSIAKADLIEELTGQCSDLMVKEIPNDLHYILSSSKQMNNLLEGLLQVSQIGTAEIEPARINMDRLITDIVDGMKFRIDKAALDLTIDPLPDCLGDPSQINQVFTNLLDNAIKYRDPDRQGQIHITGQRHGDQCVYSVEDNGIGIKADYLKKVFEIYHRLNPEIDRTSMGLGLTIVKRILERHDGDITIESILGQGSRFIVTLPGKIDASLSKYHNPA